MTHWRSSACVCTLHCTHLAHHSYPQVVLKASVSTGSLCLTAADPAMNGSPVTMAACRGSLSAGQLWDVAQPGSLVLRASKKGISLQNGGSYGPKSFVRHPLTPLN